MADEPQANISNEEIVIESGSEDNAQQTGMQIDEHIEIQQSNVKTSAEAPSKENELQIHEANEAQLLIADTSSTDAPSTNEVQLAIVDTSAVASTDENDQHEHIAIAGEIQTADIDAIIEISERETDSEHEAIDIHHEEEEDEDHIDSNTPLKQNNARHSIEIILKEEERDLFSDEDNIKSNEVASPKIYNEYMRRRSVSTSDIPHSLQVLTPQHIDRPKDDALAQISEMGFDRTLSEKAYDILLNDNNGNHGAFTTEQVVNLILSQDLDMYQSDVELNIVARKEEEKVEEIIRKATKKNSGDYVECAICRMDQLISDIYDASCSHNYCKKCLVKHYQTSIENGVVSFLCMEEECERIITEQELFLFIEDEVYRSKYYKFLRNVKLAKDHTIRWCVKAGCDTPIKRKSRKQRKLQCTKCQTVVCYECAGLYYNNSDGSNKSKQDHNCNKNLDDKLTNWAKAQNYDVEFCPRCAARIEKLSGCNHMRCTYCKYEFCWLCRKEFKKGHYDPTNIVFGCPGGENATKKPDKCGACCVLFKSCSLMCCLPFRICCWRMNEQGFPWCCCWCCCQE